MVIFAIAQLSCSVWMLYETREPNMALTFVILCYDIFLGLLMLDCFCCIWFNFFSILLSGSSEE